MRGRPGRVTKNGMAEPLQQEPLQEPTRPWPRVYLDGYFTAMRSVFFYVLVGNYVGLGALAFVASDLILFANIGPLAGSDVAAWTVWPLYYGGQFMIATGVVQTLLRRYQ